MANFNLNRAEIAGKLTADPQLKTTASGVSFTSFTIAVNGRKDKDGNQQTEFINATAWKQTAETVTRFFRKGSSIYLAGEIHTRSYEKDGQKRYITEIVAHDVKFVDSKAESTTESGAYMPSAYSTSYVPALEEVSGEEELPF